MDKVRHLGLFPFCVPEYGGLPAWAGPGTLYPVGVSLETAMRWFWRVKTWHINAAVGATQIQDTFAGGGSKNFESVTAPESEKHLVCASRTFAENSSATFDQYDVVIFNSVPPAAFQFGNLIYPYLDLYGSVQGAQITSYNFESPEDYKSGGSITIDGISVPSLLSNNLGSGSIEITAQEYWPYDP